MRTVETLREAKHQAFLARKLVRKMRARIALRAHDRQWARSEAANPFRYRDGMFPHTFLSRDTPRIEDVEPAPRILWAIWLGPDPRPRRAASLQALRDQPGLDVRLIREPASLELAGHPFHPAYHHLHVVHRSDYLRAYAMHHYGGAYCDVKPLTSTVRAVIDDLNSDDDAWAIGYREVTSTYVGDLPHELGGYLKAHYRAVLGPSAFVFRPRSTFTTEWMRELHARLDYYHEPLQEAQAAGCDPYAAPPQYPIRWSEILADITQPLCLKHQAHVRFTDRIRPMLKDYR